MKKDDEVRKTISLPKDVWEKIRAFRHQNMIKSEAQTIKILISFALKNGDIISDQIGGQNAE